LAEFQPSFPACPEIHTEFVTVSSFLSGLLNSPIQVLLNAEYDHFDGRLSLCALGNASIIKQIPVATTDANDYGNWAEI
jgi:hypothetical protein